MYKFRTMVRNAEELKTGLAHLNVLPPPDFKIPNDPRLTPIGKWLRKFSLDASLAACALRAARTDRPALIHGHLHEGALLGWALSRRRRVPLVFDLQGSLTAVAHWRADHGRSKLATLLCRRGCARVPCAITLTP